MINNNENKHIIIAALLFGQSLISQMEHCSTLEDKFSKMTNHDDLAKRIYRKFSTNNRSDNKSERK